MPASINLFHSSHPAPTTHGSRLGFLSGSAYDPLTGSASASSVRTKFRGYCS